jgi:(S)-mandelate dehydrogenase
MKRRYYRGRNVARALEIEELRHMALHRLPAFVREYLEAGAEDERTLLRNREAFDDVHFVHRVLVDVSSRNVSSALFGAPCGMPVVIAPTGFNGLFWRHGDIALARAARAFDIPFTVSIVSSDSLEDIAKHAGGRLWMQLLVVRDANVVDRLIARADDAGCEALVLTLDVPTLGNRTWDHRNFSRPLVLSLRAKLDVLTHWRWLFGVLLPRGLPGFGNLAEFLPPEERHNPLDGSRWLTARSNAALSWDGIRSLRERWRRKLVLKGVMDVADAEQAANIGVDGLILSNHGGRQLDSELAPLDVLEDVVAAVGSRVEIMVDGGFRRGSDVVKALALGAKAAVLGRTPLYGLAAAGQAGVGRALELVRSEIDRTLALLGCPSVTALSPQLLRRVAHFATRNPATSSS